MKPIIAALFLMGAAIAAPSVFRADFRHGFNGWMSYPLPQDIGFDPTLTVEQRAGGAVLIRQVASVGEARLSTGFIWPLRFTASVAMRLRLRYTGTWPAADASFRLILAGEDGRRYEAALPVAGPHEVTVSGGELRLPRGAAAIEAIVLVGRAAQPAVITQHQVNASTAGKGVASQADNGKPPKRLALRLASPRSTAARFEVAMDLQ